MSDLASEPQGEEAVRGLDADRPVDFEGAEPPEGQSPAEDPAEPDGEGEDEASEEVEHEGRRYRVPKALKDAFLRHADYTRKTQDLAEQRRALETQAAQIAAADGERVAAYARLMAVDDQIAAYEQIDWNSLEAQDPARAQRLWREYSQLKDGRAALTQHLTEAEEARAFEAQRQAARRVEEGHEILSRQIKDWSPELAHRLADFGQRAFGFSDEELESVQDPRMIRVLHLAWLGDQALKTKAAAERLASSQAARPASQVGANAPAGRNPDRMTTAEWMAFERDRLRRRG